MAVFSSQLPYSIAPCLDSSTRTEDISQDPWAPIKLHARALSVEVPDHVGLPDSSVPVKSESGREERDGTIVKCCMTLYDAL